MRPRHRALQPPALAPLLPTQVLELGGAAPLTRDEVLASVRRHHPPLEAAEARVVSAEGVRLASEGAFDLTLGTRASGVFFGYYEYGRLDVSLTQPTPLWGTTFFGGWRIGRGFARGGIPDYYRYDETFDGGELRLGAQIPLWRDGPIDARRAALWRAEHGVVAAAEDRDARLLRVSLAATDAYVRWVAAGRRYAIARDLLRLAEERDGQIAARAAAGAIPPIEHLENRRAVLERRALLVAARRALEQRAIALSLYLRDDQGRPLQVSHARLPAEVELGSGAEAERAPGSRGRCGPQAGAATLRSPRARRAREHGPRRQPALAADRSHGVGRDRRGRTRRLGSRACPRDPAHARATTDGRHAHGAAAPPAP